MAPGSRAAILWALLAWRCSMLATPKAGAVAPRLGGLRRLRLPVVGRARALLRFRSVRLRRRLGSWRGQGWR